MMMQWHLIKIISKIIRFAIDNIDIEKTPARLPQVKPAGDYTLALSGGVLSKIIIIQPVINVNKHLFWNT